MTQITRWTPNADLFRGSFDRLFNQMLPDVWGTTAPREAVSTRTWVPSVDIRESDEALELAVELPGLAKEDVQITLEDHILTVAGERKFEQETKGETWHRVERSYGTFSRSFTLPANVKGDKVDATFANGVLNIKLPKAEEAKPRQISIK